MYFAESIEFGRDSSSGIQLFVRDVVETSCFFLSLSVGINLFLSLLVGSLLMILYALVSCSRSSALLV